MEGFSSNLTQVFTPTGQCAEPVLPLYQLWQGLLWGYESHSAIVLVKNRFVSPSCLRGSEETHQTALREGPGSIPGSGKVFMFDVQFICFYI